MPTHPIFMPHFRVEVIDRESVFLLAENGHFVLKGRAYAHTAPLLDGRRTPDDLAALLEGQVPAAEVYFALMQMAQKGYITEAGKAATGAVAAFWSAQGAHPAEGTVSVTDLGTGAAAELGAALQAAGLGAAPAGALQVVLAHDYLQPELGEINRRALAAGQPWLLVRPEGLTIWLGPLFVPGRTGCWECLAARLALHRGVERFVQDSLGLPALPVPPAAALPSTRAAALQLAATEAARWTATGATRLEGAVLTLDLATLELTRHTLLRQPGCPACGAPADREPAPVELRPVAKLPGEPAHRSASPAEVLARYGHHVSPITGAVGALVRTTDPLDPLMHNYTAGQNLAFTSGCVEPFRRHLRSHSGGKGATDLHARAGALCEALERYSGLYRGDEPRRRASLRELGDAGIHPNRVMGFSAAQYHGTLDPDLAIDWTPLWSLTARRWAYLPTQYLYYGYPAEAGSSCARPDSNGNAAGATLEEAIFQGLMELIERDHVALWWYSRVARPGVDLESFGLPYVRQLQERYRSLGRDLWVLDLTADLGVPAFAAISRRVDRQQEQIMLGFGAHLDPAAGLLRALTELNQFLPGAAAPKDPALQRWLAEATVAGHPYLLPDPGAPARTLASYPRVTSDDVREDILHCQRLLEREGLELLVLDQTRPDIGLHVAKVVVPGLRHFWARFGPGRLYDVPVKLGWLGAPLAEADLNPIPIFI